MHYAHKFGVPLHQMAFDDRSSFYYVRNKLLRLADQPVPWPVDLTMEEQRLGIAGMFAKYIVPTIMQLGNIESPKWPAPDLEWLDRITFETFLRIKGASAGAISILRLGSLDLIGDGVGSASALSIIRDLSRTQELVSIVGGNDHLSGAFCEALDSQIRYGTRVREIVVRRDEVVLRTWSRAGAGVVSADYLICTVPFSTLSEMHVVPKWPEEKQIVIDAMRYTSVTRVFLQCRRRLWPEAHGLSNVSSDLPVMWMIDGSYSQRERRTVLECYIAGENSRRFSVMPKQRRVRAVVRSARNVFPDLPQVMESGCAYCWDNLRWSRGAYSWFSPGETVVMMRMAARREGRVFFAGEHTSPWPGWIQGALHSGYRAAVEVNEASRKPNNGFLE
jgi:monoamine oxidase